MLRPSTDTGIAEDWHQYLYRNRRPRKLTKTLLSENRTLVEKARILYMMPLDAIKNVAEMRWLESKLEDAGHTQLAQLIRWSIYRLAPDEYKIMDQKWAQQVVVLDIESRWTVQREIYVQEEIQALSKSLVLSTEGRQNLDDTESSQLDAYRNELEQLSRKYWECFRWRCRLEANVAYGDFGRAFNQHRKNPDWYLNELLRQDCIMCGGCCERSCGCCETVRGNRQGLMARGHCTSACGCCIRTYESKVDMGKPNKDVEDFPFDIAELKTPYSRRMYYAYIWGLTVIDEIFLTPRC